MKRTDAELKPLNLIMPPAARTDTELALVWDKPVCYKEVKGYKIYVNGEFAGSTFNTDYTLRGLEADTEYEVSVRSVLKGGEVSEPCEAIRVRTRTEPEQFDITEYGAVGDGKTLNTNAIQRAIDACREGGRVYVPRGTFVSGAIFLKSDMTLYLEEGAVLLGSADTADYPLMEYRFEGTERLCYASLVNTKNTQGTRLKNITIAGKGKIDANGSRLFAAEMAEKAAVRGRAVCIRNTDNLYFQDITVRQSPAWCVHLIYCGNISVNNVQIHTKYDENGNRYPGIFNGDGLDPDSSENIYIFNSMIASQDDCIAIKSGRDGEGRKVGISTENVRITNCRFKSGFGVGIGSEMSGGVRNVLVRDCQFENTYSIGTVKAPRGRGNVIENISYEDISFKNMSTEHKDCRWFRGAIYVDQFYSHETFDVDKAEEVNEGTAVIRNITFKNIDMDTVAGNAVFLAGLPESSLKDIRLENVNATGKYGMKAYNIDGLTMENVRVTSREDEDLVSRNVRLT